MGGFLSSRLPELSLAKQILLLIYLATFDGYFIVDKRVPNKVSIDEAGCQFLYALRLMIGREEKETGKWSCT